MSVPQRDLEEALCRAIESALRRVGPAIVLRVVELAVEDLARELDVAVLAHRAVSGGAPPGRP